jgi:hypothetical protein
MKGYMFVSPGSDPGAGRPLADPIFGRVTTMGMCRPDLRRQVQKGDSLFVLSGKLEGVQQYLIGGLTVGQQLDALTALAKFPQNELKQLEDGSKAGNIIVTATGERNPLDHHAAKTFKQRIQNFIIAKDAVYIEAQKEVELARQRTLDILRRVFDKPKADSVHKLIYRGRVLNEKQIAMLVEALESIKSDAGVQPR